MLFEIVMQILRDQEGQFFLRHDNENRCPRMNLNPKECPKTACAELLFDLRIFGGAAAL